MSWRSLSVEFKSRAKRDLKLLDRTVQVRVLKTIRDYAASGHGDVKCLQGSPDYRLRVGDWRVRFGLEGGEIQVMMVLRVLHRREAYRD